jgi:hypothetical protein
LRVRLGCRLLDARRLSKKWVSIYKFGVDIWSDGWKSLDPLWFMLRDSSGSSSSLFPFKIQTYLLSTLAIPNVPSR